MKHPISKAIRTVTAKLQNAHPARLPLKITVEDLIEMLLIIADEIDKEPSTDSAQTIPTKESHKHQPRSLCCWWQ